MDYMLGLSIAAFLDFQLLLVNLASYSLLSLPKTVLPVVQFDVGEAHSYGRHHCC